MLAKDRMELNMEERLTKKTNGFDNCCETRKCVTETFRKNILKKGVQEIADLVM